MAPPIKTSFVIREKSQKTRHLRPLAAVLTREYCLPRRSRSSRVIRLPYRFRVALCMYVSMFYNSFFENNMKLFFFFAWKPKTPMLCFATWNGLIHMPYAFRLLVCCPHSNISYKYLNNLPLLVTYNHKIKVLFYVKMLRYRFFYLSDALSVASNYLGK